MEPVINVYKLDFESEQLGLGTKEVPEITMFINAPFSINDDEFHVVLKKELNDAWEPYYISDGEYNVTQEFPQEIIEEIYSKVLSDKMVQYGLEYLDKIYEVEKERIEAERNNPLHRVGSRLHSKINQEIQCGYTCSDGRLVFILPFITKDKQVMSISVTYEEIMTNFESEEEFVQETVNVLKKLRDEHVNHIERDVI